MKKRVILFNGPPGCGKDTAADLIAENRKDSSIQSFKHKLFELTCSIYDISLEEFTGPMYTRENKQKPYDILGGLSPREALIKVSEEVIKPNFGSDYFGKSMAKRIEADDSDLILISDSGFMDELKPLLSVVEAKGIMVVLMMREGCSFEGDSRGYLDLMELDKLGIHYVMYDNQKDIEVFGEEMLALAHFWRDML